MSAARARVLGLFDGDAASTHAVTAFLGARGFEVRVATSGAAALGLLRSHAFDGLILEFRLGDVRGDVLLSAALALQPQLTGRVVFVTADTGPVVLDALQDFGCPIVHKPVSLDELERVVHRTIGNGSALDAEAQ